MIRKPEEQGQSIWLGHSSPELVRSDALANLVQGDGVCGLTVEPALLAAARGPAGGKTTLIAEIRDLADILHPIYVRTRRRDGYVSLPVDPAVWHDTAATLIEARRLWDEIGRDNLLVAIPATDAGIPAISALIAEGINVNPTLLFTPRRYEQAALACLDGLEKLAANDNSDKYNMEESGDEKGGLRPCDVASLARVTSIASFFLSPIDTAVDAVISSHLNQCGFIKTYNVLERETLRSLVGKAAIASAQAAYGRFQGIFSGPRWEALAAMGARKQRLLWADAAIENPAYHEMKYLEALAQPDTIAAVTPALLAAYKENRKSGGNGGASRNPHGPHRNAGDTDIVLSELRKLHISLDEIGEALLSSRLKRTAAS
jgi:transaldolase